MLKIIKIFIFAACLAASFSSVSLAADQQIKAYGNYQFIYDKSDSIFVDKLMKKIKKPIARIEDFFQYKPRSIITVIITRSQAQYDRYRMNKIPEWSQAVAFTDKRIIVLKAANAEDIKRSPEILLHEIVHIFFADISHHRRIPVWMHEGIAQYLSMYQITINDRIHLANALATDNIVSLTAMDTLFQFNQVKARLAYIEALTAVQFIVKKHGTSSLKKIISNLQKGMSVNDAFLNALGYDYIDFELYWYEDLQSHNKWLILLNFENLLWISIVILAILTIIVVKLRNRKLKESWEDDYDFSE